MASYSSETFTGSAGVLTYTFGTGTGSLTGGLKFLSSDHLTVQVDGSPVAFTVAADQGSFTISGVTIAGGESIVVTRSTPATEAGRLVNFSDLSHVRQEDLNDSALQLLYIIQETLDTMIATSCLELGVSGHWDAEAKRITNMAVGVTSTDAVTKGQLDAASLATGNLPVVSVLDNDKGLAVVSGAWAVRTPSEMRVHLGLGTAAVLTAGTGAGNVVALDGSALYPAADGRNIDLSNHSLTTEVSRRYRSTVGQVVQTTPAVLAMNGAASWSQSAGSRLTPGTLTELHNDSDIAVDNSGKKVTLSAGTWEITYVVVAYNDNATPGNIQDIRVNLTDDDDTATQTVYNELHEKEAVSATGTGTDQLLTLTNTFLLKLPAGGTVVLRAVNEDSTDIIVDQTVLMFRHVSEETA